MLAIAVVHALWGRLLLGAMAPQSQSYLISLDGADVGFATLTLERISQKELKYSWRAELAVSGDPCLRSIENTSGKKSKMNVSITNVGVTSGTPFAVTKDSCVKTLSPKKKCDISVTFSPPDLLLHESNLIITDDAAGGPQMIPLSGTGAAPKTK